MRQKSNNILLTITTVLTLLAASAMAEVWKKAGGIRNGVRGSAVGTITQIDGTTGFRISLDSDTSGTTAKVTTDSLVTQYRGFGETSTILSGTTGFSKLRIGDRIEVRGMGSDTGRVAAEDVYLLGRSSTTAVTALRRGSIIEGIVRSVSTSYNQFVIENSRREMYTVTGSDTTPVNFEGKVYRIRNIEAGDRVRVEVDSVTDAGVRARLIDVLESVSDSGGIDRDSRTVGSLFGRVLRIDTRTETFRVETENGREVRVDARSANDRNGRHFKVADLVAGDTVEISGRYDTTDNFRADTIRFSNRPFDRNGDRDRDDEFDRDDDDDEDFESVTIYGTVVTSLQNSDTLVVRDTGKSETIRLHIDSDFVVRTRSGTYVTAVQLRAGDSVVVKAFKDDDDRYIAQTLRLR